jgi:hypothetical protein
MKLKTLFYLLIPILLIPILLISCKKYSEPIPLKPDTLSFKRVLILGNNITFAQSNPSIGWYNSCGMAASVPDSDYVHLLVNKLETIYLAGSITSVNISPFETDWRNYNIDTNLKLYKSINPDLIIFRIGENVNLSPSDTSAFEETYHSLIKYFGSSPVILGVGSIWPKPVVDRIMKRNSNFFSLSSIGSDNSVYSYVLGANFGIQHPPNNKGMKLIADSIWSHINKLRIVNKY